MYEEEDYQMLKSTVEEEEGPLMINSDNIFSSGVSSPTTTVQNPNFSSIIPKDECGMMTLMMSVERGKEPGPGGSTGSGYEPAEKSAIEEQPRPVKTRPYNRHTARQIQELEAFFKVNPHPDDKEKSRLSETLGLKPLQIKFWFQNKRTNVRTQQEREENVKLRAENNALKAENHNLQFDLQRLVCSSCSGSGEKLRLENSRLRQELAWLSSVTSLMNPPPPSPSPAASLSQDTTVCFFPVTNNNTNDDLWVSEEEKAIAMNLVGSCVQELSKMCETNEPLWKKSDNNERFCLNEEEYKKMFQWPSLDSDRFRREASKANATVMMNSSTLVNTFLDADKWSEMFYPIVSRAKTIQIISSGVSGPSGSLLRMYAELQVLSPLVPTREGYFLRYVEQNVKQGKWMIVDFSIDRFRGLIKQESGTTATDQYRRKPSGCIIEDMPKGYSRITWVEHVEVEEKHEVHEIVREHVKSGAAFNAERWLAVLQRQCERIASLMATNITDLGVIPSVEARRNLMRLSQRMVRTFCLNISNSYRQAMPEPKGDTVRITSKKVSGGLVVLSAVSSTFLPYSHLQVFNLLRNDHSLSQVEFLFNVNPLQEVAHIANGSHPGNCISLLRNKVELMMQESCTDNSGSLVVYSTVDMVHLERNGEKLPLLPLGFSVVPMNPSEGKSVNPPSCLLTVGIQVSNVELNVSTVTAINNRIYSIVNKITSAFRGN